MTGVLSFSNLTGGYCDTNVVFDVSSSVETGEALGVFGRNGVGKTTLARLLQGSLAPASGSILIDMQPVEKKAPFKRRQLGLGFMPQTGIVFDDLTVYENLTLGHNTHPIDTYFDLFPSLGTRLNQKAGSMSGGERKILSFIRAMLEGTKIIILDEPSEGVQAENIAKMEWCLLDRKKRGSAIILVEQNLHLLTAVADKCLGLDAGRVVLRKKISTTTRDEMLNILSV